MKIVYLIGNGFDVNLKMNTRYKDFYEYYINFQNGKDEEIIKNFKKDLKENKNIEYWSDLEIVLGVYLKKVENKEEAIILHDDLIDKLSKYLELEEEKYMISDIQKDLLFKYLSTPFLFGDFLPNELDQINNVINNQGISDYWDVKIITFNYTKTLEKMIGDVNESIKIGMYNNHDIFLTGLEHIHGFTNKRMILGVNDDSQIANESLRTETGVVNRYIKTNCIGTYGINIEEKCKQWIKDANLICLFGVSLGNTDKNWWNKLANKFYNGNKIIFFEYFEGIKPNGNEGPLRNEIMGEIKNKLLSKIDIEEGEFKDALEKNIIPTFSDEIFKFEILTKEEFNSRF